MDLRHWFRETFSEMSLNLAGVILLADLNLVAKRTALTGTSSLLDSLVLVPGLHRQATAPELSKGEYPACAAMTTGYVFRVENPATVFFLQNVGRTGHLTTVSATGPRGGSLLASTAYLSAVSLTLTALVWLFFVDQWAFVAVALLAMVRLINSVIIQRRSKPGWFGAAEPGVRSALLVLLSQDRWVRIEGLTDDVKAVTSGTWFREPTGVEYVFETIATLLVYYTIVLMTNASRSGQADILGLLFANTVLLGIANADTKDSTMHGRRLHVSSGPKKYDRRLTLVNELIQEFGRRDCFVAMGMIQPDSGESARPVIM